MSLPIDPLFPAIGQHLAEHGCLVLEAAPGAGKTTRVPVALLQAPWLAEKKILVLEPRRVAAKLAATYMALQHGTPLGDVIGYQVRFDRKADRHTRITFITDGLLVRRLQQDPELADVGLVILDEFHERRLESDLALLLLKDIRETLRPDLRILVMSATLDGEKVARYLFDAPRIKSPGRLFPLEVIHLDGGYTPKRMADAIGRARRETDGDVLAFLPGIADIRRTQRELTDCAAFPLYGEMPLDEQAHVLSAHGDRRVILATNLAETSVTVPGVTAVVDSGLVRQVRMDPQTGSERLETVSISQASATQRAGRAGRVGPGRVYRLWSNATHHALPEHDTPDVMRADLAGLVLELAQWGVTRGSVLIDPPPASVWRAAVDQLVLLGALDPAGALTPLGKNLLEFPLHPRLAKLLWLSGEWGYPHWGADLAALLSERDILTPEGATARAGACDLAIRWEALREARGQRFASSLTARGVDPARARHTNQVAGHLLQLVRHNRTEGAPDDPDLWQRLLLAVFPDRIAKRRAQQDGYLLRSGRGMRLHAASAPQNRQWLLALQLDIGETEGIIHWATPLDPALIRDALADQIAIRDAWRFDPERETVAGSRQLAIGPLSLEEEPLPPSPEGLALLMQEALQHPERAFSWTEAAEQWQRRLSLLNRLFPEMELPQASLEELMDALCLDSPPWRGFSDLRRLDLLALWQQQLTHATRQTIDRLLPTHWTTPGGRKVRLTYQAEGPPILATRLQDLFGVDATPTLAEGRQTVLVHLLSPAGRPVQITQDLATFWRTSYQAVRRDLRGRYPKHAWPEDPTSKR